MHALLVRMRKPRQKVMSYGSDNGERYVMDKLTTESLAQFCIAQSNAFDLDDWHARFAIDPKAVALVASYLSMTSWYGHDEELEQIVAATHAATGDSHTLQRESRAIGFDLPHFSYTVRIGITRTRVEQETRTRPVLTSSASVARLRAMPAM